MGTASFGTDVRHARFAALIFDPTSKANAIRPGREIVRKCHHKVSRSAVRNMRLAMGL